MAPSTESALTTSLRLYAASRGAYVNKNHGGPNSQGRPDLEGCYRCLHFGAEVKLPGKERNVTKLQQKNLNGINMAGGFGWVITSKSGMAHLLDEMDKVADAAGF